MKTRTLVLAAGLALAAAGSAAAQDARTVRVHFDRGATSKVISDRITGYESVEYKLGAREGQYLKVSLRPDNQSAGFNVYIPGRGPGDEALYNSDTGGGLEYYGQLYVTGDHTISVFLNRNAARQNQLATYDIVFEITDGQDAGAGHGGGMSRAESDCLTALAKEMGVNRGSLSVISSEMGENSTVVKVRVPGAQAPWQCDWGYTDSGPGVLRVMYMGEG